MLATSRLLLTLTLSTAMAQAQVMVSDFLFSVSQPERTISGSGGTVLQGLNPNEIVGMHSSPCPSQAEKWLPRSCFQTMAGDEDGDNNYYEPSIMGSIDAMISVQAAGTSFSNQRTIWYSPSVALGTTVSGAPGLRPGDIGRIARTPAGDGRIEYFIRREQINTALGLPIGTAIDVDAAAFGNNYGLFLSLDTDIVVNLCGGPVLLRDGDVFVIAPMFYIMTTSQTIGGVAPNSAVVVHTEAQMDLMVANANVSNRFGVCIVNAVDTESLEIDWSATAAAFAVPTCTGVAIFVPHFLFTTETMTGGAILSTQAGGMIATTGCGLLGTPCGFGPTFGNQIGLLPPAAAFGIASYVNALAVQRIFDFEAETVVPVIPVGATAQIDFHSPGPLTWVFLTFAPGGVGAVPVSSPFPWSILGFPDMYAPLNYMGLIGTAGGFGSYVTPPIPFPCDLIFSGIAFTSSGGLEISTPTMVEVF